MFPEYQEHIDMLKLWIKNDSQTARFNAIINQVRDTYLRGGKLIFCGNGGSAAEASHFAAEFIGKCAIERRPLPSISIVESPTQVSAISNDFGFQHTIIRGLKALHQESDFVILMSTSGESENILEAISWLERKRSPYSLWTSEKCSESLKSQDYTIISPTRSTPRAQELHLVLGHILAEVIERDFV